MWRRIHGESLSLRRVWVLHFVLVGVGIVHDDYVVNLNESAVPTRENKFDADQRFSRTG